MLQRLDVEPERGRDGVDVLTVKLLEDGRLAGVVKTAGDKKEKKGTTLIKYLLSEVTRMNRGQEFKRSLLHLGANAEQNRHHLRLKEKERRWRSLDCSTGDRKNELTANS